MKRGIAVLLSLSVLVTSAYFTASKWAIRHETISFYDRIATIVSSPSISPFAATRRCRLTPA